MKELILLTVITIVFANCYAQDIPAGSCGILFTYDAAGNRTKREYYCNNTPPGGRVAKFPIDTDTDKALSKQAFVEIDALYPNPTSGQFSVTFSNPLNNASILLTDINGKIINQFKASGTRVNFNLTSVPSGVYFIRINNEGNFISKKVIKN